MSKRTQARNARGQKDRIRQLQLFLGRTLNELADEYDADSILLSDTHPDHVWALVMGRYTGMVSAGVYDDARGLYGDLVRVALAYLAWAVAVEARGQTPWRNFSLDYPLVATASDRSLFGDPPELPVVRRRRSVDGQSRRK
jgi:hypothetical protein